MLILLKKRIQITLAYPICETQQLTCTQESRNIILRDMYAELYLHPPCSRTILVDTLSNWIFFGVTRERASGKNFQEGIVGYIFHYAILPYFSVILCTFITVFSDKTLINVMKIRTLQKRR